MRRLLLILSLISLPAWAQDDSLYRAWGGKAGIQAVMVDFAARLPQDARIGRRFQGLNAEHLANQLTEQLCELAGGPCQYQGPDMRAAHQGMEISKPEFNALVEVLQQAMAARGIPFAAQNRMLAKLAPMHRDIIDVP
ncbi:hemoglobin [Inhella inkyongensis]|uniref:Hemoglobin n=1 Tax=Inhella inkyongensis TaxID=392593 RepID=A0A840S6E1_9BURK|nr:group 1 truncated hemoglobin [Inhella inkyongensis]MBB5204566.1 hemoglobin [Inhella inkyongensis]